MQRVVIVNPAASGVDARRIEGVKRELAAAGPLEVLLTDHPGHAVELAAALPADCASLYVLAGDGGYNEVVNGIQADLPIGFIPGGKTSVLPRALGLPRDPVACARHLAVSRTTRRIGLGCATYRLIDVPGEPRRRRFTFSAGVGLDAELVRAIDKLGRDSGQRPGDLAFAWELARLLARHHGRIDPVLEIEGHGRTAFLLAANCDPYSYVGPFPIRAAPGARFELGLDVVAPRRMRPADIGRFFWWILINPTQQRSPDVVYLHDVDRISVRPIRPTPMQVDGEDLGDVAEVILESERAVLTVMV